MALKLRKVRYDPKLHVAILSGAGRKSFCAGSDLREYVETISRRSLADGMELAMACDIRIAADHARFGVVNRRWNVGAESGLTQRLPHIVGLGVALDLLITGRWFDAREAYRINFVSRVVKAARLMDECTKLARQICAYPQSSLRTDKEACIRGLGLTLEEGLRLENTQVRADPGGVTDAPTMRAA